MSKIEKIKRVVLIALGFGLATYLIMSGMAMLDQQKSSKSDISGKVHSDAVK
jgi:hypothetical protein